jgi:peptidyl-prolyl cis-trans isomerase SurA
MTKHRFFTGSVPARPLAAALALLLALPVTGAQAQGLKPSAGAAAPAPEVPLAASALPVGASPQRQADFIVVVVNSEPITNNEIRARLSRTEVQLKKQGMVVPPRRELVAQLLERMILDKIQLQTARTSGLKVEESAIEASAQSVARQNQVTLEEMRKRLKADGIEYSQFRAELRDDLLLTRLRQREVESQVTVSEQEIDQFLSDQQTKNGASAAPVALNLGEILVAVPENATPEQVAALQTKAQQVLERIRAGGDFAALAAEFSASASRGTGGQMGLRSVERYPPLFVEATQTLRVGQVTGPVRSGAGFHILKLLEKKQASLDAVVTQTHARHILLRPTPQLTEAAAIEKLASFKKRILAGQADFAELARDNSQDGSAKEGGDLGWANPGMFVPEFDKAMNALAANQISEPLVSRFGVHLVQVLQRRQAALSPREQRDMVREMLREKKQADAYVLWAQELRGRAYVEMREAPQ